MLQTCNYVPAVDKSAQVTARSQGRRSQTIANKNSMKRLPVLDSEMKETSVFLSRNNRGGQNYTTSP